MHYKYFRLEIDPKRVPNFPDLQDQIEVSNHPAMKSDNSNIVYIPGNNSKKISWLDFYLLLHHCSLLSGQKQSKTLTEKKKQKKNNSKK